MIRYRNFNYLHDTKLFQNVHKKGGTRRSSSERGALKSKTVHQKQKLKKFSLTVFFLDLRGNVYIDFLFERRTHNAL